MNTYAEKRANQKAKLSKLSEAELRDKWQQNDYTLWEFERDAEYYGYSSLGNEYMSSDIEAENSLINEILRERGLAEEERPFWSEEDEGEESGYE